MTDAATAVLTEFHFLRPALLWLLPLAASIAWAVHRASAGRGGWSQLIDPALMQALRIAEPGRARKGLPWLAAILWVLGILAMSGPAWERLPEPVHRKQDALIIALALSDSMRATDVQPSRLERARFQLRDILDTRREGQTALIVYSGDAHVVTPLTDDARTIAATLQVLDPSIMPSQGSNIEAAVALADTLLRGAGLTGGRLLLVTDHFPSQRHAAVAEALQAAGLQLSALAVGSRDGAPIAAQGGGFLRNADGSIMVPGTNIEEIRAGTAKAGGRFAVLQTANADLASLLPEDPFADIAQRDEDLRLFDQWLDRGPWLLVLLLPFAALGFRRGWLFSLTLLMIPSPPADAFEWQDLWLRPDQQAAEALAEGDAKAAASLFESPDWRGTAEFRAGDFEAATHSFSQASGADASYNRGNALARAGKLDEAIKAYDQALSQDPGMEDAIANRELVQQLLDQQQQDQQQGDSSSSGDENQQNQRDQKDAQSDADQGTEDDSKAGSEDGSDNNADQNGRDQGGEDNAAPDDDAPRPSEANPDKGQNGETGEPQVRDQDNAAQPSSSGDNPEDEQSSVSMAEQQAEAEQRQAIEQWLRQVPDNPGELLRRKFEYEYLLKQQQAERN